MPEKAEHGIVGCADDRLVCAGCGGTGKSVIPPSVARQHLYYAEDGAWFHLVLCIDCGTLWVQAPYEPYASFIYLIRWPYSREFWCHIDKLEGELVIARWCSYKIRQAWPGMTNEDRLAVMNHRRRSIGRNPIDEAPNGEESDPLAPYLAVQAD